MKRKLGSHSESVWAGLHKAMCLPSEKDPAAKAGPASLLWGIRRRGLVGGASSGLRPKESG